jgi:hypothetical protein
MSFSEKDKKVTVTIGLIMSLVASAFFLGTIWQRNQDLRYEVEGSRAYTEQEVLGLRADWERNNKKVEKEFDNFKKEMDIKIKNHEAIYHKE